MEKIHEKNHNFGIPTLWVSKMHPTYGTCPREYAGYLPSCLLQNYKQFGYSNKNSCAI